MEPTYRQALTHAWRMVTKHKIIWIFGLFSVVIGQYGLSNYFGKLAMFTNPASFGRYLMWFQINWLEIFTPQSAFWLVWLLAIVLAITVFVLVVSVGSRGALLAATGDWYKKKTKINFYHAWHRGIKHGWRLFAILIMEKAAMFVLLFFTLIFLLGEYGRLSTISFLGMILLFSLLIFMALAVEAISIYAAGFVVEEEKDLWSAVPSGARLFARHILVTVELSLLIVALNVFLLAAVIAGSVAVLIPAFLVWLVAGVTGSATLWALGVFFGLTAFIIFLPIVGGIFNAFTTAAWMYLFIKMKREGLGSRMVHLLQRAVRR